MSSFDPMAAAIDWLDAYRAADLSIVDLYAADAALACNCDGDTLLTGKAAFIEHWRQRFAQRPAGALERLRMKDGMVVVSYAVPGGIVHERLKFNDAGLIFRSQCDDLQELDE